MFQIIISHLVGASGSSVPSSSNLQHHSHLLPEVTTPSHALSCFDVYVLFDPLLKCLCHFLCQMNSSLHFQCILTVALSPQIQLLQAEGDMCLLNSHTVHPLYKLFWALTPASEHVQC